MYCTNCGKEIKDNGRFCVNCGSKLVREEPTVSAESVSQNTEQGGTFASQEQGESIRTEAYTQKRLKQIATSMLYLVTTIVFSVLLLLNISQGFFFSAGALEDMLASLGLSRILYMLNGEARLENIMSAVMLLAMTPTALVVTGMWMVYVSARNPNKRRLDVGGVNIILTLYKVLSVVMCILLAIVVLSLLGAASQAGEGSAAGVIRMALFVILIVGALTMVYYYKLLSTIRAIRDTIVTGIPNTGLSTGVAVVCFITGGLTAIGAFSTENFLLSAVSAAAQILAGTLICKIKSELEQLEYVRNLSCYA